MWDGWDRDYSLSFVVVNVALFVELNYWRLYYWDVTWVFFPVGLSGLADKGHTSFLLEIRAA